INISRLIYSIKFYQGIVVVEKEEKNPPRSLHLRAAVTPATLAKGVRRRAGKGLRMIKGLIGRIPALPKTQGGSRTRS
ncbi:hypothetical protein, partial [Acetobacter syzygii]|uniref:hypothetical protein n=1 Tax=Acetobacter syzygii TaxID=146476 RepID=UPI0039ED30D1